MKYLLDTNALLWAMEKNPTLTKKASSAIADSNNDIYVSIVSLWEIAIKLSIGKLDLTQTLDDIIEEMTVQDYKILPISVEAVRLVRMLPYHHRDPFDRAIIAQGLTDNLQIITSDEKFDDYGVERHW
jgi:PIN domain nuclease of toxin-antitoxin system